MDSTERTLPLVVVGVDGSPSSIAALRAGRDIALRRGARLRAISTWSNPNSYSPFLLDWSPEADAEDQLRSASRDVFGADLPDWYEQVVTEGAAARTLIAESRGAELLVLGSRGHGGFVGLLLGSVGIHCAGHAFCPVMIVRDGSDDSDDSKQVGEQVGETPIVVGHDGSPESDAALEWALQAAESMGCPVEVVRTWSFDRIPPQFNVEFGYVSSFTEVSSRVRRDLVVETSSLTAQHPTVIVTHRAVLAQPAEELIESSSDARMVVVGTRGRGAFAGMVLGSVSTECAAHSQCPVVVVPAPASAAEGH